MQQIFDQILDRTNLLAERQRSGATKKTVALNISGKRRGKVMVNAKLTEAFDAVAQPE